MVFFRIFLMMIILSIVACSEREKHSSITFSPTLENQAFQCDKEYVLDNDQWKLSQFYFYISQVSLQDTQGNWQSHSLKNTPLQSRNVALLGQSCRDTQKGNWQLLFEEPLVLSDFKKIKFSLGIPFELNHLNPLTQESPLNDSTMFWVWQTGHKFIRLEMDSERDDWVFHLGSTGCKSPSVMRSPSKACLYPNLYSFEVEISETHPLIFDLSILTQGFSLSSKASCQSEHENTYCQSIFNNLHQENIFRINNGK